MPNTSLLLHASGLGQRLKQMAGIMPKVLKHRNSMLLYFSKDGNMYIIICEMNRQSSFDAWDRVLRAGAQGWPWGMGWGGRQEGGSGWGTHVHLWLIHVNVWQNQYNTVISLQLKFKKKDTILRMYLRNKFPNKWYQLKTLTKELLVSAISIRCHFRELM